MKPAHISDEELVSRFKSGDVKVFEDIIHKYENNIYSFGYRMCGNPSDAEDILQDTFLNAYKYLDRFRGESSLNTWLHKIASSSCIKKRRRRKSEPEQKESFSDVEPMVESRDYFGYRDWSMDPISSISRKEMREVIGKSLKELPKKYRAVFILRDMQGLSTEETAGALKMNEQSVKTRLHRARLYLRKRLKDYAEA
jgi:RNA polymerase sigma-70 factor (ECF subfamily)